MAVKKAKSKAWYTITSPEIFGGDDIGKTTATDPAYLKGRIIEVSAVDVTNNFNKFYLKFKFRAEGLKDDKLRTTFDGSECMRDYISRMILRHIRRIDSVQDLTTKDGVAIRVKTIAVVSKKMKSSIVKIVRRRMQEMVKKIVESSDLGDFVSDIVEDRSKIRILDDIRRIYPVRNFEFRKTQILRAGN